MVGIFEVWFGLPCNDGMKLPGYSPCGWLSAGPYHSGVVLL